MPGDTDSKIHFVLMKGNSVYTEFYKYITSTDATCAILPVDWCSALDSSAIGEREREKKYNGERKIRERLRHAITRGEKHIR